MKRFRLKSFLAPSAPSAVAFALAVFASLVVFSPEAVLRAADDAPFDIAGKRVITINCIVRVNQIEVSRDRNVGNDEGDWHDAATARRFREAIADAVPDGRIVWAFSWLALQDPRPNYVELRKQIVEFHKTYGDEITFIPGAYFAPMYNTRAQTNADIRDGLKLVSDTVGDGYRPKCIIGGFLAAENMRYLTEEEGIRVAQGTVWSQYGIDNGDGDGSLCYPYYPSREHACKPAQNKDDFIDCVNLDGWTCDFLCARRFGFEDGGNSRLGVGPIESYGNLGLERGLAEATATTRNRFKDKAVADNGFGWVTVSWELSLAYAIKNVDSIECLNLWLKNVRQEWPDAILATTGEFGEAWRRANPNNDKLNYRFVDRGTGVEGAKSEPNLELTWYMNRDFRLALLRDWEKNETPKVIDFTRYDLPAAEPADPTATEPTRNWSLINRINQKRRRPQDAPVELRELPPDDQARIRATLPELAF